MKTAKRERRSSIIALAFVFAAVILFGAIMPAFAQDNRPTEERYMVGDTVSISDKTVTVDGESLVATAMVEEPSGALIKVDDTFLIREEGLHRIIYRAVSSKGGMHEESSEFLACAPLYRVHTSLSSVSFGNHKYGDYTIDRDAVLASIASTDKFTYSEIIDLAKLNGESFLEFFVTPEKIGTHDANKIEITLTDVYDSENFVTIAIKKGTAGQAGAAWAEKNSYITANAADQAPTGLERNKGDLVIDGTNYQLHKADVWGANVSFALPGNPGYVSLDNPNNNPESVGSQTLALSMDVSSQAIYANGQLVTILSSEDIYGEDIWSGFTTGECFLTISATGYNASALNLAITKLGAYSAGSDDELGSAKLKDNLFADTAAPVIELLDKELYADGYPYAVVGVPYTVFPVKVQDDYAKGIGSRVNVYYEYGTGKQALVEIKDGTFIPFKEGEYTIVYSAADLYGNQGKLEITLDAEPSTSSMLDAEIPELTEAKAGNIYTIPAPIISNSSGITSWRAEAVHKKNGHIYEISSDSLRFFPEYSGEYEITYYVNDYISSISVKVSLDVAPNDTPIFFEDPVLPRYFIYGCEYQLPGILARIYPSEERIDIVPEIYIIEDGGAEREGGYRFISYARESVQIIYRYENNGQITEYVSDVIPVIDVGYNGTVAIKNYFVSNALTLTSHDKYINFAVDADAEGVVSTTFINKLQTFDFSLKFSSVGFGMSKVNIYLTDYADPSVQLKFTYRYESGQVYFSINDGAEAVLEGVKFDSAESPMNLALVNNGFTVMPTGTSVLSLNVTSDLAGNTFKGFTDSMAYMTVELEDVTNYKQAGIDIYNISGQPISGIYIDNIKPKISATAQSGARPYGTQFVIPAVFVADVLDPSVSIKMSVTAPDGSFVTTVDGVVLNEKNAKYFSDYTIVLDQYGSYSVNYTVTDISGNKLPFTYVLTCSDMEAPVVTVKNPVKEGSVGKEVFIADIEISDNNDKELEAFTVYTFVTTPQGQSFAMTDKAGQATNAFTAKTAGIYTVSYMVIDSSGNMTLVSYEINIK